MTWEGTAVIVSLVSITINILTALVLLAFRLFIKDQINTAKNEIIKQADTEYACRETVNLQFETVDKQFETTNRRMDSHSDRIASLEQTRRAR